MKNLSAAITVTRGAAALPALQELLGGSGVAPSVCVWAPPLPNLGNNTQTTVRPLFLFFAWKWHGQSYSVWKRTPPAGDPCGTGGSEACGKDKEMQPELDGFLCVS